MIIDVMDINIHSLSFKIHCLSVCIRNSNFGLSSRVLIQYMEKEAKIINTPKFVHMHGAHCF